MSSVVEISSDNEGGAFEAISDSQKAKGSQSVGVEGSNTRKRRQPSAQSPDPTKKKQKTPTKMVWTAEKTAVIMQLFVDCHRNGLFNSSRRANFKPAWEKVLADAVEYWPTCEDCLSVKTISNKYDTERRRYLAWMGWVNRSGNTCNPENGACAIVRESDSWQAYLRQHGQRRIAWLGAGQPLGPVHLYQELFSKEKVKGDFVAGPEGDDDFPDEFSLRAGRYSFDESRATTPRGRQSDEGEGESERESLWESTTPPRLSPAPSGSGLTAAQAHRRATDPDIAVGRDVDVRRGKRVYRGREGGREEGGREEGGREEGGWEEGSREEGSREEASPPPPDKEDLMANAR